MNTIFIGLIFVLFDFSISIGSVTVGLIPSFVGFLLICKGVRSLYPYSYSFKSANIVSFVSLIFSALLYAIDLFALSPVVFSHHAVSFIVSILSTILYLIVLFHILKGIQEIEEDHDIKLGYSQLMSCWTVILVSKLLLASAGFIPLLALLCLLLSLVISIVFLVFFLRTNKAFTSLVLHPQNF